MKTILSLILVGFVAASPLLAKEPKLRATLKANAGKFPCMAFSPDSKTLAARYLGGNVICLWDVDSGKKIAILEAPNGVGTYLPMAYSPDGKTLASGTADQTVNLWDLTSAQIISTFNSANGNLARTLAFSPDGKTLTGISGDGVTQWDVATGQIVDGFDTLPSTGSCVAYGPDGNLLVAMWSRRDQAIKLLDAATEKKTIFLQGHTDAVSCTLFSPDGETLASGSGDKTIKLWSVSKNKNVATLKGHGASVLSVDYSPNGKTLASGSKDRTIKLWDLMTGEVTTTLKGHNKEVTSLKFSPDGKVLASAVSERTIWLWDLEPHDSLEK